MGAAENFRGVQSRPGISRTVALTAARDCSRSSVARTIGLRLLAWFLRDHDPQRPPGSIDGDGSLRPLSGHCPIRPRGSPEGGERSFAEACLNGEVAPISAISGTPTVKRTPRGPGQALGPSPAPVTFRPTGRLKGVFCLAPSCLFLRGRANRPTTPIRGALQPTVAGDPWVIYRSRDFVDRDFVGDAAQRAALRCRGETAGFEQGRGLGVGNDRPRRQDRT